MSLRERLCDWLGIEENGGPNSPKVNDEEILNVLRREKQKEDGEDDLTTKEIADELPIVRKTVAGRLKKLADERVEKRRAGTTDMWRLADGEPKMEVNPKMGLVVEYSSRSRRRASKIEQKGRSIAEIGLFLLIIGMTIWLSEITVPVLSEAVLLSFGYAAGLTGGATIGGAAVLRLIGLSAPRMVERFLMD